MKTLINADRYFEQILKNGVVLFGMGSKGRAAIDILNEKSANILAIYDNNKNLWGEEIFPCGGRPSENPVWPDIRTVDTPE